MHLEDSVPEQNLCQEQHMEKGGNYFAVTRNIATVEFTSAQ